MSEANLASGEDHNIAVESYDEDDGGHQERDTLPDGLGTPLSEDYAIDNFLRPLVVDDARLYQLACRFSDVYAELAKSSDQQFLPTPVTQLPTGQETGKYLAIDVGGSNLRVAFIELLGEAADQGDNGSDEEKSRETIRKAQRHRFRRTLEKAWPIGEHLKTDKAQDLFLWIGDCMAEVVADSLTADFANGAKIPNELEMGITFSFPMM